MQVTHLTTEQSAELLHESETITRLDWGGSTLHVMTSASGRDFFMVQNNLTGASFMIDGSEHDHESGGSAHEHARAMFRDAA